MTKQALIPCVIALAALFSCTKDDNTPPTHAAVPPSKMELLTSKQWIYTEIYNYYYGDSASATVLYRRGVTADTHRDSERDLFWKDGQVDMLFDNDNTWQTGRWYFTADSNHYVYTSGGNVEHATILQLDSAHFAYWDTDHNVWGKMIPKQ
jgi:hypothetical protein